MKKQTSLHLYLSFIFIAISFVSVAKSNPIKKGIWYTNLYLNSSFVLPFNCELRKDTIVIKNAEEEIKLSQIKINDGKISIKFPIFNSELKGEIINKKTIKGYWHNYSKGTDYKTPFESFYGIHPQYKTPSTNIEKFTGKWEVTFDYQTNEITKSIGLFSKFENHLKGTFLTETGDYRFLEGVSFKDSLQLSCFDGSHAFLFTAQLKSDTLWGNFLSGTHYKTKWYAVRNDTFELQDPEKLTYLVNKQPIEFQLLTTENTYYKYPNETLNDKVVLIQIMGSWCPNCYDETNYLKELYAKHSSEIEILGVGFETPKETFDKIMTLNNYKRVMEIPYPLMVGGDACKSCAINIFPMLNDIVSFPTLIIIDKKGQIRKIHTGFSGPGTGEYYTQFVKETNEFIEFLINE